jgi:hypothetical protein
MNRTIVLTCLSLVALVCFALSSADQEASAGLFNRCGGRARAKCCEPAPVVNDCDCGGRQGLLARLKARRCKKAECCEPAPTCCEPAPTCCEAPACEPACGDCASDCGAVASDCGCGAPASDCGCGSGEVIMEAAPAMPEEAAPAAPEAEPTT